MPTVEAIDVSKFLLFRANHDGEVITNLKMQKLLYYAQAWHLVNFGTELFKDDIEAWPLGPVIPSVYREYKKFGPKPIEYKDSGKETERFSEKQVKFLEEFYSIYIRIPASQLVNMAHNEEPWKIAFKDCTDIDTDLMKKFYSAQYKKQAKN